MLLEVLSVVGPVLYWMGLVQGDRKLDGLSRWDGSLKSIVVPPHLLEFQRVLETDAEQEVVGFDSYQYPSSNPKSVSSDPASFYSYLYFGIAIMTLVVATLLVGWIQTHMRSATLESASQTLTRQIQNSLQPLVRKVIKRYHSIHAENKCYSDLTDVLYARIRLLKRWVELVNTDNKILKERVDSLNTNANTKNSSNTDTTRGQKETLQSNLEARNQELNNLRAEKNQAEFELRERGEELETLRTEKDQEIETQRGQKETLQSNLEERDQELNNLRAEKSQAESELREKGEELATLGTKKDQEIESQRGQKETLQSNLEARNQELYNLRAEKSQAESELRETREELATLRTEKDQAIEIQRGQKEMLQSNLEARNQELYNLRAEKSQAESELRETREELATLRTEKDQAIEIQRGQKEMLQSILDERDQELDDLRAEENEAVSQLLEKHVEVEILIIEAESLEGQMASLHFDQSSAQARVQELERDTTRLQEDLKAQIAVVSELRAQLALRNGSQKDGVSTAPKPTSVAGEVAQRNPVPARPPKSETKGTPMTHTLPPKPSFNNKTPLSSPASNPDSSPGADLLPSLLSGSRRPKGSAPPLLPHHQSFGATQNLSQGASSQPFPPFPPFRGFQRANPPLPGTMPGYLPSKPSPAASSSPTPNPSSKNPSSQSILTTSTIDATNGPSLFSNITGPSGPSGPRGPSLFGVFPPQSALFQNTNPLPGLSTLSSSQQSSATANAPLPGTKPGYLPSTPGPAESSSPIPNPLSENPSPQSILTTSTIDATNGPSLFSNITGSSGPSGPRGPRGPRGPSLFGNFLPQSTLFQNTNPLPGLSMPDSSQQSSATPLPKPAKEVVNPFADSFFDENKAAAGDELASRAIRPMRKRRVVVSRPWPHARQTVGDSTWHTDPWHTDESVSWPHARQLNGKPNWR